jgi:protease-4
VGSLEEFVCRPLPVVMAVDWEGEEVLEVVREVAGGRVWTGEQACQVGLVDKIGGMETALEVVKRIAGIPLDVEVAVKPFPRNRGLALLSRLMDADTPDNSQAAAEAQAVMLSSAVGGTLTQKSSV